MIHVNQCRMHRIKFEVCKRKLGVMKGVTSRDLSIVLGLKLSTENES
jgi:hypothetical protein